MQDFNISFIFVDNLGDALAIPETRWNGVTVTISKNRYSKLTEQQRKQLLAVFAALDLPIEQFYDLMHWYLRDDPANVLHPSVKWVCEKRAREMSQMLVNREKRKQL